MKKTENGKQLSLFDIQLSPPSADEIPHIMQTTEKPREPPKANRELCPYRIPTVEEIMKDFQNAATTCSTGKLFEDTVACGAIAISNAVDFTKYDEREERYKQIMNGYQAEEQQKLPALFAKVLALLSSVVYDNGAFNDYLGEIFMRLNIANKKVGQVFTPFNVSRMMAQMIIGDGTVEKAKQDDEILTIADPCCGSGTMSLAALETLQSRGVNYARNVFIECSDIDIRCVYMAYLQLSLAGVPAIIKHQNTVTMETWDVWKTPAFILQYVRFSKYDRYDERTKECVLLLGVLPEDTDASKKIEDDEAGMLIFVRAFDVEAAELKQLGSYQAFKRLALEKEYVVAVNLMGESQGRWVNAATLLFGTVEEESNELSFIDAPAAQLKFKVEGTFKPSDNLMKILVGEV